MTTKLMTIWGVMLALLVRAFRVVASACSAVRSASIACVRGVVRVFVTLALCLSAPAQAIEWDKWYETADLDDIQKRFIALQNDGREYEIFMPHVVIYKKRRMSKFYKKYSLTSHLHNLSSGCHADWCRKDPEVVQWLLKQGMNPNIVDMDVRDYGHEQQITNHETPLDRIYSAANYRTNEIVCGVVDVLKAAGAKTYSELQGGDEIANPCDTHTRPTETEPQADYTGLYANAAFAVAGAFAPSWVDTQTFAFNEGNNFITRQSLSVPLDDFTFGATRVQVNDLTDYEFAVKWEMEF